MATMDAALRARAAMVFGWVLRDDQEQVISAVVAGRDALAVMPTGSGKSAIYQVAGLVTDGLVVVVSPLVALQEDQVAGLRQHPDAPAAAIINASEHVRDLRDAWDGISSGRVRFVFLAPEQLAKDEVVAKLRAAGVAFVTVDEAHCVSSWGDDFRPSYLLLAEAVQRLGRPPVLALTATGSAPVRRDIVDRLGMHDPLVLASRFDRPELRLEVVRHEDADSKHRAVVEQVSTLSGAGIVYVATRAATFEYAAALRARGRTADPYNAGMRSSDRERVHAAFRDGGTDVVVATTAFGMGIDKHDVRFVVHADVPEPVDAYYQEVGRGGRGSAAGAGNLALPGGGSWTPQILRRRNTFSCSVTCRLQRRPDRRPHPQVGARRLRTAVGARRRSCREHPHRRESPDRR
jgi:ATP-dependent DNA helicase RecQ